VSASVGFGVAVPGSSVARGDACMRVWVPWVCAHGRTRGARHAVEAPACARPRHRGGVRGHRGRGMTTVTVTAWQGGVASGKGRHGPCRVVRVCKRVTSWPPRVAACRRQGGTAAVSDQGKGSIDGSGVHARARVLASQDHGVGVPCAGHRHPGPAA
jgi:hypothetical protein